jgi:hypothetical protein
MPNDFDGSVSEVAPPHLNGHADSAPDLDEAPPFGKPLFPEHLREKWDALGSLWIDSVVGPWDWPNVNRRSETDLCVRAMRQRGWTADEIIEVAPWCDEGIGQLTNHGGLIRELWAEHDERLATQAREKAKRESDPFAIDADGLPPAMTAIAFLAAAREPRFLIDPIIQLGFLYTLTARSFHGKTTTMIYLSLCVAMRRAFAGLHTEQGQVAYFIGENPDEFAQKLAVACDFWGINPADLPITFIPGAFDLTSNLEPALAKAAACGPLSLVIPDTSAAFRYDDSEDDNQQSKLWGQTLRAFTQLPGNPAVITPTHPTKNADRFSLMPRGGSSFFNEVDSNLTLWADLEARTTELHWLGKHRGSNFKPITFELRDHPHPTARHRDGRPIQLAVVVPGEAAPKETFGPEPKPSVKLFYGALLDAITLGDKPGETTRDLWQAECVRRDLIDPPEDGDDRDARAKKRATLRAAKSDLLAARWIGIDGNRVFNLKR